MLYSDQSHGAVPRSPGPQDEGARREIRAGGRVGVLRRVAGFQWPGRGWEPCEPYTMPTCSKAVENVPQTSHVVRQEMMDSSVLGGQG